jgi:hypothetical protein
VRNLKQLAVLLVLLALIFPISATTLVPMELAQLERAADTIVVGRCIAKRSGWQGKKIVTVYTVNSTKVIKGATDETLQVIKLGGVVNKPYKMAMIVPDTPELKSKHTFVLFLTRRKDKTFDVVGWRQGCLLVNHDDKGSAWISPPIEASDKNKAKATAQHPVKLSKFLSTIKKIKNEREAQR